MTINLPPTVENSLRSAVLSGQFASLDDAMTEAVCLLLDRLQAQPARRQAQMTKPDMPAPLETAFDSLPDDVDLPDKVTREALKGRHPTTPPLVTGEIATAASHKPIWEVVDELRKSVPPEEFSKLPKDGAEQLDHYLYGSPKRPTA